MPIIFL